MPPPRLILASRSPRRAELLLRLGLSFEVIPAEVDERYSSTEPPPLYAERLAREKALAVWQHFPDALVIGADTTVVVDNELLGKPFDPADAVRMLSRLSGRAHHVFTAVAIASPEGLRSAVESVQVHFRQLSRLDCVRYAETGEPLDKAGGYGIQGFGAALVDGIEGDYFAVVGLPIVRTLSLLRDAGWDYLFGEGLVSTATAG